MYAVLRYAVLAAGLAVFPVHAQDEQLTPVPEPPDIPEQLQSGEVIEPEVTITRRQQETVVEYRVNGILRAIRVIPDVGYPYYLVDTDGDGDLETRRNSLGPDFLINQWVIFSW